MQSKSSSRLALAFLAVLPSFALSACASGPEVSAFATAAESGAAVSTACRSARQTADIYREMQLSDGGIPYAMPTECAPGSTGQKRKDATRVEAPAPTATAMKRARPDESFDHSPG